MCKVIIAGSRGFDIYETLLEAIEEAPFTITEVVSGGARGVDRLGELYAEDMNIPLHIFNADWNRYGKKAGHLRNAKMAENADALLALWDGVSPGTKNMIETAKKRKLAVYVKRIDL